MASKNGRVLREWLLLFLVTGTSSWPGEPTLACLQIASFQLYSNGRSVGSPCPSEELPLTPHVVNHKSQSGGWLLTEMKTFLAFLLCYH